MARPITGGALGTTHDTSGIRDTGGAGVQVKPDPDFAYRLQYANPGGMWMPQQMVLPHHLETFRKLGVKMDPKTLADPLSAPLAAIVSLGGCTASFVSGEGLIVTNHHCVQQALNHNSTKENNLVENGFLAKTRAEEKNAGPAQRVYVAQAFKDVTSEMREGLDKVRAAGARREEVEKRQKQLIAACEKGRPHLRCTVSGYFRGGMYVLAENLEIRDVRLVYVPARAIGNYGGEVDNWEWPRHTGDFSFYRAYVGKDGMPADYAADNVPYQPKHFLKVSSAGVRPGDFVMVAGYPGSTRRTDTALETHHDVDWGLPYAIAYAKERYAIVDAHTGDAGETGRKAGVMKQFIQNGLEKNQGVLKGLTSGDLLARKDALDRKIKDWAKADGRDRWESAIAKLDQLIAEHHRTAQLDYDLGAVFGGSRLLSTAISLTRWAEERAKKDADRKPGYQDRDLPRALAGQRSFAASYDRLLDRLMFRLALVRSLHNPEADRPWLHALLDVKKGTKIDEALIDKTLDAWYGATTLEADDARVELQDKGTAAQLKASKDPFLMAAQRIWATYKAEEKKADARWGERILVTPFYAEAMREALGGVLAPDANGTLRITYGTVKSFKPESSDLKDSAFTVASQILTKNTGKAPFDAPKRLLEAIQAKKFGPYAERALGNQLPVNFLADLDTTGGNSGSPVLNAKGELVGLNFDSTLDGVASDVVFAGTNTRKIECDARYMLWTMDLLDGADHLIKEMGLQPQL
ncbi:MAG: S46 family peptidase [Deltaproteobacteria bacterium]|nr:S46 family peptidase [Deltaproteobacteria bacterium]